MDIMKKISVICLLAVLTAVLGACEDESTVSTPTNLNTSISGTRWVRTITGDYYSMDIVSYDTMVFSSGNEGVNIIKSKLYNGSTLISDATTTRPFTYSYSQGSGTMTIEASEGMVTNTSFTVRDKKMFFDGDSVPYIYDGRFGGGGQPQTPQTGSLAGTTWGTILGEMGYATFSFASNEVNIVQYDGTQTTMSYTFNGSEGTIGSGTESCSFTVSGHKMVLTYPADGTMFWALRADLPVTNNVQLAGTIWKYNLLYEGFDYRNLTLSFTSATGFTLSVDSYEDGYESITCTYTYSNGQGSVYYQGELLCSIIVTDDVMFFTRDGRPEYIFIRQ